MSASSPGWPVLEVRETPTARRGVLFDPQGNMTASASLARRDSAEVYVRPRACLDQAQYVHRPATHRPAGRRHLCFHLRVDLDSRD